MSGLGLYGKLPALGDFVQSGLPLDFVKVWDVFLQETIAAARSALGPAWQDSYQVAPIWRFTLGAGLAGAAPMTGVVMPSVDRVGREFPLTLAGPLPASAAPVETHLASEAWFDALENIALGALDDGTSRDDVSAALNAMATPPVLATNAIDGGMNGDGLACGGQSISVPNNAALAALAAHTLHARAPGANALWSAIWQDRRLFLALPGLPGRAEAAGLFTGMAAGSNLIEGAIDAATF